VGVRAPRRCPPAQWPALRLRGQESDCSAPLRLHSFTSASSPLAIIRGLFAPLRNQQCCKNETIMAPLSTAPVGAPLTVPDSARRPAVLSSKVSRLCSACSQGSSSVCACAVWPGCTSRPRTCSSSRCGWPTLCATSAAHVMR